MSVAVYISIVFSIILLHKVDFLQPPTLRGFIDDWNKLSLYTLHKINVVKILDSCAGGESLGESLLQHYIHVAKPYSSMSDNGSTLSNIPSDSEIHGRSCESNSRHPNETTGEYSNATSAPVVYGNSMVRDRFEHHQLYVCSIHKFLTAKKFIELIDKNIERGRAFPYVYICTERMRCVWHMGDNDSIGSMLEKECKRQKLWLLVSLKHINIIDTLFKKVFHLHVSVINCLAVPSDDFTNSNVNINSYGIEMKMIVQHQEALVIVSPNLVPAFFPEVAKYCQEVRFLGGLAGDVNLDEHLIELHVGHLMSHFETNDSTERMQKRTLTPSLEHSSGYAKLDSLTTGSCSHGNDLTIDDDIKLEVDELPVGKEKEEQLTLEHCEGGTGRYFTDNISETTISTNFSIPAVPLLIVPPRHLESNGPCLLVQCPLCWTVYRGSKN